MLEFIVASVLKLWDGRLFSDAPRVAHRDPRAR